MIVTLTLPLSLSSTSVPRSVSTPHLDILPQCDWFGFTASRTGDGETGSRGDGETRKQKVERIVLLLPSHPLHLGALATWRCKAVFGIEPQVGPLEPKVLTYLCFFSAFATKQHAIASNTGTRTYLGNSLVRKSVFSVENG